MATKITILQGDVSTKELVLEPSGTVPVKKGKKVRWVIDPSATNVNTFRIEKKKTSPNIFLFLDPPPSRHTRDGGGTVDVFAKDHTVYDYSIFWTDKSGVEHECDPKLAIMPSLDIDDLPLLLGGMMLTALGLMALQYWRITRRRK